MEKHSLMSVTRYIKYIAVACSAAFVMHSCASMGNPGGGLEDLDPPKVVKSTPAFNELNVKQGRIEVVFDELIKVEKPMDKVIITPPQKGFPVIKAQNNKVIVELKDSLLVNTTYTIDFTDAIVDNNEGNALENFSLSFSTGDVLDSLGISGKVLSADNLEPMKGIYVGIHSNMSDTAFTKLPFRRISRTSETGGFTIKGIAPGKYKVFALNDVNRNYFYDNPDEIVAFYETLLEPSSTSAVRQDSVFKIDEKKKMLVFDSLKQVRYTRFLPDDIVLRAFKSAFKRQLLSNTERIADEFFSVFFTAPQAMPKLKILNVDKEMLSWTKIERTQANDTLKFWITDPAIARMDTLQLEATYFRTDSLDIPQLVTEIKNIANRKRKVEKKDDKKKKDEEESVQLVTAKTNLASVFDINKLIEIEFDAPMKDFDKSKILLQHIKDTLHTNIDFQLREDSLNPRRYELYHKWISGGKYKFAIDSAAVHNYFGLWNNRVEMSFTIKSVDKYGALNFSLSGLPSDTIPAFVELLDKTDKPVYKSQVKDGAALFMYIDPKQYYARIVIDSNGNGKWDTGDYNEKREPEAVYYWNKYIDVKEFGEHEEDWNITATPLDKQKPLEITKNKPQEREAKRKKIAEREARREQERQQQNGSSNTKNSNNQGNNNSYQN